MTSYSQQIHTIAKLAKEKLSEEQLLQFYKRAYQIFTYGKINSYQVDEIRREFEGMDKQNRNGDKDERV